MLEPRLIRANRSREKLFPLSYCSGQHDDGHLKPTQFLQRSLIGLTMFLCIFSIGSTLPQAFLLLYEE